MPLGGSLIFKPVASVAIVAGTPAAVWTPAAGKKFRLMGFQLGCTVAAASIIFKEGAGNAAIGLQTPVLGINGSLGMESLGGGILSAAADNVLKIDVSANSTVTGTVWGFEEA